MATFRFDPNATLIRVGATVVGRTIRSIVLAVDTGSTTTLISRDIAFEIGLDPDASDR